MPDIFKDLKNQIKKGGIAPQPKSGSQENARGGDTVQNAPLQDVVVNASSTPVDQGDDKSANGNNQVTNLTPGSITTPTEPASKKPEPTQEEAVLPKTNLLPTAQLVNNNSDEFDEGKPEESKVPIRPKEVKKESRGEVASPNQKSPKPIKVSLKNEELIEAIKGFKRDGTGAGMMRIDKKHVKFLSKARIATDISTTQILNYMITYFLEANEDFVKHVNKVIQDDNF